MDGGAGCAWEDPSTKSYGAGFNDAGGGVFATLLTNDELTVWFWSRDDVPDDVANSPDTSTFPQPVAQLTKSSCDVSNFFGEQTLTWDITLCGEWIE